MSGEFRGKTEGRGRDGGYWRRKRDCRPTFSALQASMTAATWCFEQYNGAYSVFGALDRDRRSGPALLRRESDPQIDRLIAKLADKGLLQLRNQPERVQSFPLKYLQNWAVRSPHMQDQVDLQGRLSDKLGAVHC